MNNTGESADSSQVVQADTLSVTGTIAIFESSPEAYLYVLTPAFSADSSFKFDSLTLIISAKDEANFPVNPRCYYSADRVWAKGIVRKVSGDDRMEIARPDQISVGNRDLPFHSGPPIRWEDANKFAGKIKVVEGVVASAVDSAGGCKLVLERHDGQTFEVDIVSLDIGLYRGLGIGPSEYYTGKLIRATGVITDRGRLAIKVDDDCMVRIIGPARK